MCGVATAVVEMLKVADVAFAATVTVAGTTADGALDRETTTPPTAAGPVRPTVPVDPVPQVTDVGLTDRLERAGGLTVRAAVFVTVPAVAVIVAVVQVPTGMVVTVNDAVVAPAATVTLAGAVAAALLLVRLTAKPPASAMLEIVTVPVVDAPPVRVAGESARLASAGAEVGVTVGVGVGVGVSVRVDVRVGVAVGVQVAVAVAVRVAVGVCVAVGLEIGVGVHVWVCVGVTDRVNVGVGVGVGVEVGVTVEVNVDAGVSVGVGVGVLARALLMMETPRTGVATSPTLLVDAIV